MKERKDYTAREMRNRKVEKVDIMKTGAGQKTGGRRETGHVKKNGEEGSRG